MNLPFESFMLQIKAQSNAFALFQPVDQSLHDSGLLPDNIMDLTYSLLLIHIQTAYMVWKMNTFIQFCISLKLCQVRLCQASYQDVSGTYLFFFAMFQHTIKNSYLFDARHESSGYRQYNINIFLAAKLANSQNNPLGLIPWGKGVC